VAVLVSSHRADAGHDLLQAERLGDVVVAADGQALDLVVDRVTGRHEDDGQLAARLAEPAGHLEAVHIGEHDVEDHEVRVALRGARDGGAPVVGDGHVEAGEPERRREQLTDVGLVLDHEERRLGDGGVGHGGKCAEIRWELAGSPPKHIPEAVR